MSIGWNYWFTKNKNVTQDAVLLMDASASLHDYQEPPLWHVKKNSALQYIFFKTAWSISPYPFHLNSANQLQVHGHLLADIFPQLWLLPAPSVLHRGAKTSFLTHSTFYFFRDTAGEKKNLKCEFLVRRTTRFYSVYRI